jgi:hypothetical protein
MKIFKNDLCTVKCFDPKHYPRKSFWVFLHADWENPFIIQKKAIDGAWEYNIASVNLTDERYSLALDIKATLQQQQV